MFSQLKNKKLPSSNSLIRQTISGTIALILLTQIITIFLFATLILRPQLQRMTAIMASNIAIFSHAIEIASPNVRDQMMADLQATPYIEILKSNNPPDKDGPPPRIIERVFMRILAERLRTSQPEIIWRTDKNRKLWVQINLGNESFWISSKYIDFGPTGLTIFLFVIVVGGAIFIAIKINTKILKPLDELKNTADSFSLNNNLKLLDEVGPEEILGLRQSFNAMLVKLQKTEQSRNIVLAGISHDLRTPLSKLRLAIEMVDNKDEYLKQTINRQLSILENNLSDFLTYARGFEHEKLESINLKQICDMLILEYPEIQIKNMNISSNISILARQESLKRAFRNIIENAIKYAKPPIEISVKNNLKNFIIEFRDYGDGIIEENLNIISEPFVRGNEARHDDIQTNGHVSTGLGLAIVDKIAKSHNGELKLKNIMNGLVVSISLSKSLN